jgi:acetyl-CoA acetyltransferase
VSGSALAGVAVAGGFNTRQARQLPDADSLSVCIDAAQGALAEVGLDVGEVDRVIGGLAPELIYEFGLAPIPASRTNGSIAAVAEAAAYVASGLSECVLIVEGAAGQVREQGATAAWTRPQNEFVGSLGLFTAAEFALNARRYMHLHNAEAEDFAFIAATIRNNGGCNPEAAYFGRGPFSPADILASRTIADPFRLLDCAMTSEGATALVVTRAAKAAGLALPPVRILGFGSERLSEPYRHPPVWDDRDIIVSAAPAGYLGRGAARRAFGMAGIDRADVDVFELYDPFSFEIIRQFEAFEYCGEGEGSAFLQEAGITPDGRYPITTDGGTMSFSHPGNAQMLQRAVRAVHQLQRRCASSQIPDAEIALCSNGGSSARFMDVMILATASAA